MDKIHEIENLFYECYSSIDETNVIRMNEVCIDGALNNVIVGLEKHCYGIHLVNELEPVRYRLFYINGSKNLEGHLLELTVDNPRRDELVLFFARFINHNYDNTDLIDVFNTFQKHTCTLLEKLNYRTITSLELERVDGYGPPTVVANAKGIVLIRTIERVGFYKGFFNTKEIDGVVTDRNYVYLMLNTRSYLVKIGMSKNPGFRERTLQSQEPEIVLVACWEAPSHIEKELHKQFSSNRERGEWFKLGFKELNLIKTKMTQYI